MLAALDLIGLIGSVGALGAGGAIATGIGVAAQRRKVRAEAHKLEKEGKSAEVAYADVLIGGAAKVVEMQAELIAELRQQVAALVRDKEGLEQRVACLEKRLA